MEAEIRKEAVNRNNATPKWSRDSQPSFASRFFENHPCSSSLYGQGGI